MIWNLTKISQILQLTGGGPGYETSILAVLLYRFAYGRGAMGLAYAVGVILLLVTIGFGRMSTVIADYDPGQVALKAAIYGVITFLVLLNVVPFLLISSVSFI